MKKFVAAVAFMWMVVAQAATVNLFVQSSGAGWDIPATPENPHGGFKQQLAADGHYQDGLINSEALAVTAFNFALEKGFVPATAKNGFVQYFLERHGLPPGSKMTEEGFRQAGQSRQFSIDTTVLAKLGGEKGEVPATPTALAAAKAAEPEPKVTVSADEAGTAKALKDLEAKVQLLEKSGDVSGLKAELQRLEGVQKKAVSRTDYDKLAAEMSSLMSNLEREVKGLKAVVEDSSTGLQAAHKRINIVKSDIATLETNVGEQVKGINNRLDVLETEPASASPVAYIGLVVAATAVCLSGLALYRLRRKVDQEKMVETAEQVTERVMKPVQRVLSERLRQAEEGVEQALAETATLAKNVRCVEFDKAFDEAVGSLRDGAKCAFWKARVLGVSGSATLAFVLTETGRVSVRGVSGESPEVRLNAEAIKRFVTFAAQADEEGETPLVGLSPDEMNAIEASLFAPPVSEFSDTLPADELVLEPLVADPATEAPAPVVTSPKKGFDSALAAAGELMATLRSQASTAT